MNTFSNKVNFNAKPVYPTFKYNISNEESKYISMSNFSYHNIRNENMIDREKNTVIMFMEQIITEKQNIASKIKNIESIKSFYLENLKKLDNFDDLMYIFKDMITVIFKKKQDKLVEGKREETEQEQEEEQGEQGEQEEQEEEKKEKTKEQTKQQKKQQEQEQEQGEQEEQEEEKKEQTKQQKKQQEQEQEQGEQEEENKKELDYLYDNFNPNINKNVMTFLKKYLNRLDDIEKRIQMPFSEYYIDNNSLTNYITMEQSNYTDYNIFNNKNFKDTPQYNIEKNNLLNKIKSMKNIVANIKKKIDSKLIKKIIDDVINRNSNQYFRYYYFPLIYNREENIESFKKLFFPNNSDSKNLSLQFLANENITLTQEEAKNTTYSDFLSRLKSSIILHQLAYIYFNYAITTNIKNIQVTLDFNIKDLINNPFYNIKAGRGLTYDRSYDLGTNFILEALQSIFLDMSITRSKVTIFQDVEINNKLIELNNTISNNRGEKLNYLIDIFKNSSKSILIKTEDDNNIKLNPSIIPKEKDYKHTYSFDYIEKIDNVLNNILNTLKSTGDDSSENTMNITIDFKVSQFNTDEKKVIIKDLNTNNKDFYAIFQTGNIIKKILDWYNITQSLIRIYKQNTIEITDNESTQLDELENILKNINLKTIHKDLFFISESIKGNDRIGKYFEKIEYNYNKLLSLSNIKNQFYDDIEREEKIAYARAIANYSRVTNTDKTKEDIVNRFAKYILTKDEYDRLSSSDFISNNRLNSSSSSSSSSNSKILYDNLVTGNILKLKMIITYYNIFTILKSYILTEGTILFDKFYYYNNDILEHKKRYVKIKNIEPINFNEELVNTELRGIFVSLDKMTPVFKIDIEILSTECKIQYMININNNSSSTKENKFLDHLKNIKDEEKRNKESRIHKKGVVADEEEEEEEAAAAAAEEEDEEESKENDIWNNELKSVKEKWPLNVAYAIQNTRKIRDKAASESIVAAGGEKKRRISKESVVSDYSITSSTSNRSNIYKIKSNENREITDLLNTNKNLFRFYDNSLFSKSNKGSSIYFDPNIKYEVYENLMINFKNFYKKYKSYFKKLNINTIEESLMDKDAFNIIKNEYNSIENKSDAVKDTYNEHDICTILTNIYINKIFFNPDKNKILYYNNKFLEISDVKIYPIGDSEKYGFETSDWIKFAKSSQHKVDCNNFKYYYEEISQTTRLAIDNVSSVYKFYIDVNVYLKNNEKDKIPIKQRLAKHYNCYNYANYFDKILSDYTYEWPDQYFVKKIQRLNRNNRTIKSTENKVILRGGKIKNKTLRNDYLRALDYYIKNKSL